jgi:CheY-like chemotaxis protein/HPt (histidine-containing phosphotransfer) domain-containing protein
MIDFNMRDLVESAVELLAARAHAKNVDLGVYIEPSAARAFRGDPGRIRQILLNLIGNGIKFTEKGAVGVNVAAAGEAGGVSRVRFNVTDTGIGMPEDVRARLFEKFTQADNSITRRYGGTGLGLAICKQLVGLMDGTIDVESRPGKGSRFWFDLPLEGGEVTPVERNELLAHLKGVRALAVDDIEMNLDIISRQLEGLGMVVTSSHDGFAALAEIERAEVRGHPYDIVFLDQMMPGLSGDTLAGRIRALPHPRKPKLVLVSSAGPHGRSDATRNLLDAILDKPVLQRDLIDCMARLYAAQNEPSAPAPQAIAASAAAPAGKLRLLLAEDNKINQKFALALLARAGYAADVAENGLQAVDAVRRHDYDAVLMDIQMPELDGIQATKQIRAMPGSKGKIPIIALTAHAMAGAREEYLAAGMDDYVSKPIEPPVLLAKLAAIAGGRQPMQAPPEKLDIPDVEQAALDQLRAVMDRDSAREFVEMYIADAGERLARMKAGQERAAIAADAHALIGIAGNVGATRVCELAREVETACKSGDEAAARRLLEGLEAAEDSAAALLTSWLKEL